MKRLLLITLIIASAQFTTAQKIRFTDTSNIWSEFISIYNDGQGGSIFDTYYYIQDSTVDSIDYRMFSMGSDVMPQNVLIREDTILNKVYIRDEYSDSEVVFMDYNLVVGDTFSIAFYDQYNQHRYAVIGLDSVLINATWHKVWTFSENLDAFFPYNNSIVIEGIGPIGHPLYLVQYSNCVECSFYYMYCFSNNGTTPLVSPGQPYTQWSSVLFDNDSSCTKIPALHVSSVPYSRHGVEIFPNPAHSSINLTSPGNITSLTISNVIGQVVYSARYNSKQVQVDIAGWPNGIYLVRVNDAGVIKFIKE